MRSQEKGERKKDLLFEVQENHFNDVCREWLRVVIELHDLILSVGFFPLNSLIDSTKLDTINVPINFLMYTKQFSVNATLAFLLREVVWVKIW